MSNIQYQKEVKNFISLIPVHHYSNSDNLHGISHVKRTLLLAIKLLDKEKIKNKEERDLIAYACIYHDIGRITEGKDIVHGYLSWRKIRKLNILDNIIMSDEHKKILQFIIINHCIDDLDAEKEIDTYNIEDRERTLYLYRLFKDVDALDRIRLKDLDPEYLRLSSSLELISIAEKLINIEL